MKLKDVYPLYLNNEAQQPNADLEVTDKYTGKVAFRVRPGRREDDRRGHRRARSRRPSRWRGCRAMRARRCSSIASTASRSGIDELAYALCVEAGKPIKDSEGEVTRLIDTFRIAAEESVRMTGEVQPLDISPARQGLSGHLEAGADRAVQLHLAVQLPAQPRRAQDRAGDRGRLPVRDEAGVAARRWARSSWARCWPRPICPKGAFSILPAHREGADLFTEDERLKLLSFTGSPGGRLGPQGQGRQEEGGARARRQRGGDRRQGRRPRRRARADRSSAPSTSRASPASASSAS